MYFSNLLCKKKKKSLILRSHMFLFEGPLGVWRNSVVNMTLVWYESWVPHTQIMSSEFSAGKKMMTFSNSRMMTSKNKWVLFGFYLLMICKHLLLESVLVAISSGKKKLISKRYPSAFWFPAEICQYVGPFYTSKDAP